MPGRKFLPLKPFEGNLIIVTERFLCAHFQPQTLGGLTGRVSSQCGAWSDSLRRGSTQSPYQMGKQHVQEKCLYRTCVLLNYHELVGLKTELWHDKDTE